VARSGSGGPPRSTKSPERPKKIDIALTRGSEARLLALLDPYSPKGSTRFVNFH
jgi:hypothetical protein